MDLINNKTTKGLVAPKLSIDTGFIHYKGVDFVKEDILELHLVLKDAMSISKRSKILFSSVVLNYEIITNIGGKVLLNESDIVALSDFYSQVILHPNLATRENQQ